MKLRLFYLRYIRVVAFFALVMTLGAACTVEKDIGVLREEALAKLNRFKVTFNINGGSGKTPSAQTIKIGSSITLPDGDGFSKTGYVFGGWNTEADGIGNNYSGGASYTPAATITLYAKWIETANARTITFDINGGTGTIPPDQTVSAGDSITLPNGDGLTKTGYVFGGWSLNADGTGTNYSAGAYFTPENDITLYARWIETANARTVTFDINGGTGTVPPDQTVSAGFSITLPNGDGLIKTGYVFGGWNTKDDGTGTNYNGGASYTPAGNITLYARWIETANARTVTFDLNGGTGTVPPQTVSAGDSITLPGGGGLSKTGYVFGGWSTNAAGTGSYYDAGESYTPAGNITLYAKWDNTNTNNDYVIYKDGWKNGFSDEIYTNNWKDPTADGLSVTLRATDGNTADGAAAYKVQVFRVIEWMAVEIRAANELNLNNYNVLSFKIKGSEFLVLSSVIIASNVMAEDLEGYRVTCNGESGNGISVDTAWKTVRIPIPTKQAKTTGFPVTFIFYPNYINGKTFWLDDIKFTYEEDVKLSSIVIAADPVNLTYKTSGFNWFPLTLFDQFLQLKYTVPGAADLVTLSINPAKWHDDFAYNISSGSGSVASILGDHIQTLGAGSFTLKASVGSIASSSSLSVNVKIPQIPNDNGYPADVPWKESNVGFDWMNYLPAERPIPTPGMIDDFTYAHATKNPVYEYYGNMTVSAYLNTPYWYGSTDIFGDGGSGSLGDGECWAAPVVDNPLSLLMTFGEVPENGWMGMGRTGLLYDLSTYTTIRFKAVTTMNTALQEFAFFLYSGDSILGTDRSAECRFTPTQAEISESPLSPPTAANTGREISIPLSTFEQQGVDLTEITGYSFFVVAPSSGGELYIFDGIWCE